MPPPSPADERAQSTERAMKDAPGAPKSCVAITQSPSGEQRRQPDCKTTPTSVRPVNARQQHQHDGAGSTTSRRAYGANRGKTRSRECRRSVARERPDLVHPGTRPASVQGRETEFRGLVGYRKNRTEDAIRPEASADSRSSVPYRHIAGWTMSMDSHRQRDLPAPFGRRTGAFQGGTCEAARRP